MVKRIKCAIIFLMVFALLPTQVNAGEIVETPEESVGQIVETPEGEQAAKENHEEPKQEPEQEQNGEALKDDETDSNKEDKVEPSEITGTEIRFILSSNPEAEIAGDKMKVIKNKKYVFSITITNNSSSDLEEFSVTGGIYNEENDNLSPKLKFYPQNGVTIATEAEVALLKSGESITLQAEVVMPGNMGDTAILIVYSELYDVLGYEEYYLLLVNEKKEAQENPTPGKTPEKETLPKTAAKPAEKATQIKTAAKTGDDSSTIVYLGVITLSALTIIVSRKRKLYK